MRTLATSPVGSSLRRLFGLVSLVTLGALSLGSAGCETASTSDENSITGVVIRTTQLLEGTGCGTRPGQVYKYLAVAVYKDRTDAVAAGVYDCFADAAFVNLPADNSTTPPKYDFDIYVYAFDASRYEAQKSKVDEVLDALGIVLETRANNPRAVVIDPVLAKANGLTAYARSRCTVTQVLTVQSVAACSALR